MEFNHDYPYHDYHKFVDGVEPTVYNVGKDNIDAHGDQHKYFVSKDTMLYATTACQVRFNSANNVVIDLLATQWYNFECNIYSLHVVDIAQEGILYAYFEGVLPGETRTPR